MIKSFKQNYLEEFWNTGKHKQVPTHLTNRILRKLDMLNAAKELRDLVLHFLIDYTLYLEIKKGNEQLQ